MPPMLGEPKFSNAILLSTSATPYIRFVEYRPIAQRSAVIVDIAVRRCYEWARNPLHGSGYSTGPRGLEWHVRHMFIWPVAWAENSISEVCPALGQTVLVPMSLRSLSRGIK